jgi:hypothetical protein
MITTRQLMGEDALHRDEVRQYLGFDAQRPEEGVQ